MLRPSKLTVDIAFIGNIIIDFTLTKYFQYQIKFADTDNITP